MLSFFNQTDLLLWNERFKSHENIQMCFEGQAGFVLSSCIFIILYSPKKYFAKDRRTAGTTADQKYDKKENYKHLFLDFRIYKH